VFAKTSVIFIDYLVLFVQTLGDKLVIKLFVCKNTLFVFAQTQSSLEKINGFSNSLYKGTDG
jgi:hypothetical protein